MLEHAPDIDTAGAAIKQNISNDVTTFFINSYAK
jgi:hypothetical protein